MKDHAILWPQSQSAVEMLLANSFYEGQERRGREEERGEEGKEGGRWRENGVFLGDSRHCCVSSSHFFRSQKYRTEIRFLQFSIT